MMHRWWIFLDVFIFTGSGIAVSLLGVAYFANIQHLAYFIVVQILSGMMQVWPVYNLHCIVFMLPFIFLLLSSLLDQLD